MEQQIEPVSKAGLKTTLNAWFYLIAEANPVLGR